MSLGGGVIIKFKLYVRVRLKLFFPSGFISGGGGAFL